MAPPAILIPTESCVLLPGCISPNTPVKSNRKTDERYRGRRKGVGCSLESLFLKEPSFFYTHILVRNK